MNCYLKASLCFGAAPGYLEQLSVTSRPHLITRLLQERNVARFIVAPVGFGKTALVYDYCKTVFSFKTLAWLDCANPRFLRDLDNNDLLEFLSDESFAMKLVVFEDIPLLDEDRQRAFSQCIDVCIDKHIEVIVTCVPSNDAYGCLQKDRLYLPTSSLLLTNEELIHVARHLQHVSYDYEQVHDTSRLYLKDRPVRATDTQLAHHSTPAHQIALCRTFQRIPQVCWQHNGHPTCAFIEQCLRAARDKRELFFLLTLLIVHRASIAQLEDMVSIDATWLSDFARMHAFVEFDVRTQIFETLAVDVSCILEAFMHVVSSSTMNFDSLDSSLNGFLSLSHCASVHDYFEQMSDVLCSCNNYARALQCVTRAFCPQEQLEWCLMHNSALIEQYCLADSLVLLENVLPHVNKHKAECLFMCAERHFYFNHYKRARALAACVLHEKDAPAELKDAALNVYMCSGGRVSLDAKHTDRTPCDKQADNTPANTQSRNERSDSCSLHDILFASEQENYKLLASFASNKAPQLAFKQPHTGYDTSLYWCAFVLLKIAETLTQQYQRCTLRSCSNAAHSAHYFDHLACLKEIPAAQRFTYEAFSKEIHYINPLFACLGKAYTTLCKEQSMFPGPLLSAPLCRALHASHVLLEYEHMRFQKMSPHPPAQSLQSLHSPIDSSPCSSGRRLEHNAAGTLEINSLAAPSLTVEQPCTLLPNTPYNARLQRAKGAAVINALPACSHSIEPDAVVSPGATSDVSGSDAPVLSIHIFGRFRILCNGIEVTERLCKRHKVQTLLAVLLLNKEKEIPKTVLGQLLWPESSIPTARKNLYSLWSVLNHALSLPDGTCPYLIRSTHAYAVNTMLVHCDIDEFRVMCSDFQQGNFDHLRWRHYLDELSDNFQDVLMLGEYDNAHVIRQRETCRTKLIESLVCAAQLLYSAGDYTAASNCAGSALHFDTTREDVVALLMRAYLAAGQRMKAINTYRVCKEELMHSVGIQPCEYVQQLYKSALRNDYVKE